MQEDKIVERIRKLLALSKSTNRHEAATAAARAAELMAKHQIAEAALADTTADAIGHEVIDRNKVSVYWKGILACGIAKGFGCAMYWRRGVDSKTVVVGRPSDIAAVKYMYAYLAKEVRRLADEDYARAQSFGDRRRANARAYKNAFRRGAVEIIARRLERQRQESMASARAVRENKQALARIDRVAQDIERHLKEQEVKPAGGSRVRDVDAYQNGRAAGRKVALGRAANALGSPTPRMRAGGSR